MLTHKQLIGTWIGVHTEPDLGAFCPLPAYLHLSADSTCQLGMVDESEPPVTTTWALQRGTLRLDTVHYAPGLVTLTGDLLRIGVQKPMTFRRFQNVPLDSFSTQKALSGRAWQTDSLVVHLHVNGRACLEHRTTGQRTVHNWSMARQQQSLFLIIRGNAVNPKGSYTPLWQVINVGNGQLRLTGWDGHTLVTPVFRLGRVLSATEACLPVGFQTCDYCFSTRRWTTVTDLPSKHDTIAQILKQHYQPVGGMGQSGLLRLKCTVSCGGEYSLVTVYGVDEEYQERAFAPAIIRQLLAIFRERLAPLVVPPATESPPVDADIQLTFRLKDGALTDFF